MRNKILSDLTLALKNQNKEELSVLRMLKGAMQLEEIKLKRELNDDEVISLIAKQIKTRKESIVEFEKGNRSDLVDKTNNEISILNKYMPKPLTDDEINSIIDEAFKEVEPTGISDMGKLMGIISPKVKGRADLGMVNKIIKDKLA